MSILRNMDKKSKQAPAIKMVVGLGNPGEEYAATFHNAGARFVAFLGGALAPDMPFTRHASKEFLYLKRPNAPIFVIPQMFMNESGRAAARAARFFHISPAAVLIAHDDADLELGAYRYVFDRGAAGHHGVESVIAAFGTKAFPRLRIGIRRSQTSGARKKASAMVLEKMSDRDADALTRVFAMMREGEPLFLRGK